MGKQAQSHVLSYVRLATLLERERRKERQKFLKQLDLRNQSRLSLICAPLERDQN